MCLENISESFLGICENEFMFFSKIVFLLFFRTIDHRSPYRTVPNLQTGACCLRATASHLLSLDFRLHALILPEVVVTQARGRGTESLGGGSC